MKLTEALELLEDKEFLFDKAWKLGGKRRHTQLENVELDVEWLLGAERYLGLHDRANVSLRVKWVNFLHDILAAQPDCPVNKVGNPLVSDIDKLLVPVEVRCLAFVMAAEWKANQEKQS